MSDSSTIVNLDHTSVLPCRWAGVQSLLVSLYPRDRIECERRREKRYPFPYLIDLTPVTEDGGTQVGDPITVVGKHISQGGVGFYSSEPTPYRHVVAKISDQSHQAFHMLIELLWCRFTHKNWYENGGRIIGELADFEPPGLLSDSTDYSVDAATRRKCYDHRPPAKKRR